MMVTSTQTAIRRVLFIGDDPSTHDFFRQALHVSNAAETCYHDGTTELVNDVPVNSHALSFGLVNAKVWQAAYQELMEAKEIGLPFVLIVVSVRMDAWDLVRENIEKIWQLDEGMRCIVCVPSETGAWPMSLALSRPDQWIIFRMPGLPGELFQLVACLSGCSISSSSPLADVSTNTDPNNQMEHSPQLSDSSDIAEQQAELVLTRDELATSKIYVNNVLRSMADSLLVIDATLTIGSVNPSLLELLGYEEDALVGQSPGLIFGEEFAQGSIIENLLLQGSVSGIESSFLTSAGQLIPISVSGSMMQDEQGQFQGLVCVAQDITERKRMEEEKLQLHGQLLDTSRKLGMAEVASYVLHNVGNVLNSINVSIGVVADLLKNSMVGDVGRISQLFHKHHDDLGSYFSTNPKGKQIPAYLEKLAGQLVEEQRVAIAELDRLRENAQHAQHCVAAQQDVAKVSGISEPIAVLGLMEEAVAANQDLLAASQIGVIREFEEIPLLIVDKHQVLEILFDVIRNACQAMTSAPMKQLIVRAKIIPGPPDSICFEVEDSGVGLVSEDLTKIFGQGQNNKEGTRGMSLHNGALMAKNLGGDLRVHSAGIGHGATFSLELPGNFHFPDL
jgi:PAS domain S-box-containing protein